MYIRPHHWIVHDCVGAFIPKILPTAYLVHTILNFINSPKPSYDNLTDL